MARSLSGNVYLSYEDRLSNTTSAQKFPPRVSKLSDGNTTWEELQNDLPSSYATKYIDSLVSNTYLTVGSNNKEYLVYTKLNTQSPAVSTPVMRVFSAPVPPPSPSNDAVVTTPKQMESLKRGVVAVRLNASQVFLSWRLLGKDPSVIAFNVYRNGVKVNATPVSTSTNYTDNATADETYIIKPVINGVEGAPSEPASVWAKNYLAIPLQIPAGGTTPSGEGYTYNANDASLGDLDGDGEYEIILKWDPSNSKDNSQAGYTGNVYLDAYKLNGTRLWRIDLGKNIRAGAHYTQFMVYDLDGDGYAEVACKTADGTVDGEDTVIGDATVDYRNSDGYILSGPEFLTIFNGRTGAAMATKNYLPARGIVSSWGDSYGNRVDRFVAAVAYLDGARPSLVMGRGYYTRLVRAAWDWRDGQLTSRWVFDSNSAFNADYASQGNHQMTVGDPDGDGKDEVINGSSAINDNGVGLWTDKRGHGDALHMSDMDPAIEGQEIWMSHEDESSYKGTGLTLRKAKTGELIWGANTTGDVGRAMAADIDPRYPGYELWGSRGGNIYDVKGASIGTNLPSMNSAVWWDGDLSRELLDGTNVSKWNTATNSTSVLLALGNLASVVSNNSTKANAALTGDILGDWREEMLFRTSDNSKLILFTTDIPTEHRIYTLMHDPQYRTAVAWQNSGYNQPPHPGFFLGNGMTTPAPPNIIINSAPPETPTITAATSTTFCAGSSVVLTSSSVAGNQWYKDGTAIANAVNATYTASEAGSYTVKVTNDCCASAASTAVVLTVNAAPTATITAGGPLQLAEGGTVTLSANAGAALSYKWLKDGVEISGATASNYTASQAGSYSVTVSSNGCSATSGVLAVTNEISVSYTGSTTFCQGGVLILTSSSASGNQWYKDGAAITNETNRTYTPTTSGAYTVKSGSSVSAAVNVVVNPLPVATITANGPLVFLSGGSVVLSAGSGSGYGYKWLKNGSEISGVSGATYTATEAGDYTVLITADGCSATSAVVSVSKVFTLPASNFQVSLMGENCRTSNNGKISVTAVQNLSYTATLVSNGLSSEHPFTSTLDIPNLSAGTYSLCITLAGQPDFRQCFDNLVIKEPKDLVVYTSINEKTNTITLNMDGGSNYKVTLNHVNYNTSLSSITLPLEKGDNLMQVSTDKECQGLVEKLVTVNDKVLLYPNPFETTLSLMLNNENTSRALVEVVATDGKRVFSKLLSNTNGDLQLELSHLPAGLYTLKLSIDNSESFFKILKK